MLTGEQITEAGLADWRKLAQGFHARYVVADFGSGARFLAAVADAVDGLGDHLRATVGDGYLDLKLISLDAVYRDDDGDEHVVEWVTQRDVDLARRISEVAAEHGAQRGHCGHHERRAGAGHRARGTAGALLVGTAHRRPGGTRPRDDRQRRPRRRRTGALPVVPGDRGARDAPAAFPPRRVRAPGARRAADRGCPGRRRRPGQRGGRVHHPRRRGRQQGLREPGVRGAPKAQRPGAPHSANHRDRSVSIGSSSCSWSRTEISSRLSRVWASPAVGANA